MRFRSSIDQSTRCPRRSPSAVSAASSGSTPKTMALGHSALIAVPIPDARPPPLTGTRTVCDRWQVLGDLEADRALPGDDVGVVERRHQDAAGLLHDLGGDLLALAASHSTTSAPWRRVASTLMPGVSPASRCVPVSPYTAAA